MVWMHTDEIRKTNNPNFMNIETQLQMLQWWNEHNNSQFCSLSWSDIFNLNLLDFLIN